MKFCKSIRPVVVLSKVSLGDRMQGLGDMAKILTKLFGSVDDHLAAFTYVFTKFEKKEAGEIHSKLQHFRRSLNKGHEKSNKALQSILQDMINKTKSGALVIDPLDDSAKHVMEHLLTDSQPIEDPQHVINEFVTPESITILQQQLVKQQNSIRGAITRDDFTLLRYRLSQLSRLSSALNLKECQDYYDAAKLDVFEIITQDMSEFEKIVKRVFNENNLTFDAESEDFKQIPLLLKKFEALETIRVENNIENTQNLLNFSSVFLITIVQKSLETFTEKFDRKLFGGAGGGGENAMSQHEFMVAASCLSKLFGLKNIVSNNSSVSTKDQVDKMYIGCVKKIKLEWRDSCDEVIQSIGTFNFPSFVENMNFIKMIEEIFVTFLSDDHQSSSAAAADAKGGVKDIHNYSKLVASMEKALHEKTQNALNFLEKLIEKPEDGAFVVSLLSQFELSKYPRDITSHLSQSPGAYYESIKEKGIAVCKNRLLSVEGCIRDEEEIDYSNIAFLLSIIDSLRHSPDIKGNTIDESNATNERIRNKISSDFQLLCTTLQETMNYQDVGGQRNSSNWNEKKIKFAGNNIMNVHKHLQSYSHLYNEEYVKIQKFLEDAIIEMSQRFTSAKIKLKDSSELPYWIVSIFQLTCLCECSGVADPKLKEKFIVVLNHEFDKVSSNIQSCLVDVTVDFPSFKMYCSYLFQCNDYESSYPEVHKKLKAANKSLKSFVTAFQSTIDQSLTDSQNNLTAESYARIAKCLSVLQSAQEYYRSNPLKATDQSHSTSSSSSSASLSVYKKLLDDIPSKLLSEYCGGEESFLATMHTTLLNERQKIEDSNNIELLFKFSKRIDAAQCLDRFLPKTCSPIYTVLYSTLSDRLKDSVAGIKDKIEMLLSGDKYKEAASILRNFQSSSIEVGSVMDETLKSASEILQKKFGELNDRMSRLQNSLGPSELKDIAQTIRVLTNAEIQLIGFFSGYPEVIQLFNEFRVHEQTIYNFLCGMIEQIKEATASSDFAKAERIINQSQEYANCAQGIRHDSDDLKTFFSDKLQEERDSITTVFKEKIDVAKNLVWSPDYFEGINKFLDIVKQAGAVAQHTSRYEDISSEIVKIVVDQIESELKEARQDPNPESLDSLLDAIKMCQSSFPTIIADKAAHYISDAQEHLKKQQETSSNDMKQKATSNVKVYFDSYVQLLRDKKFFDAKTCRESILNYFEKLRSRIKKIDKDSNVSGFFKNVVEFVDDGKYYLDKLRDVREELKVREVIADFQQKQKEAMYYGYGSQGYGSQGYGSQGYGSQGYGNNNNRNYNNGNNYYAANYQYNNNNRSNNGQYNTNPYNNDPYASRSNQSNNLSRQQQNDPYANRSNMQGGRGGGGKDEGDRANGNTSTGGGWFGGILGRGNKQQESDREEYDQGAVQNKRNQQPQQQQYQAPQQNNFNNNNVQNSGGNRNSSVAKSTQSQIVQYQSLFYDSEMEKSIASALDKAVRLVQNNFANVINMNCDKADALDTLAPFFDSLIILVDSATVSGDLYAALEKSGIKTSDIWNTLCKAFSFYNTRFVTCLDDGNFGLLAKILDVAHRQDPFINSAKSLTSLSPQTIASPKYKEFKEEIDKTKRYVELKRMLTEKIQVWKEHNMASLKENAQTSSNNSYDRDVFYKTLSKSFLRLKQLKPMQMHIDPSTADVNAVERDCRLHIGHEMSSVQDALLDLLKKIPSENEEIYQRFAALLDNFRSLAENFDDQLISQAAKGKSEIMAGEFRNRLLQIRKEWESKVNKAGGVDYLVLQLIELKKITIHIPALKKSVDDMIDAFLFALKQDEPKVIGTIGLTLNQHPDKTYTQMIINETKALNGYSLLLRNEKTLRFTHSDVLAQIEFSSTENANSVKEGLKLQFEWFDKEYWNLVESGLIHTDDMLDSLPNLTKKIAQHSSISFEEKARHIVAHVCAFWTLKNHKASGNSTSNDAETDPDSAKNAALAPVKAAKDNAEMLRPHAAQIISIFRLLGIQSKSPGKTMFSDIVAAEKKEVDDGDSGKNALYRQLSKIPTSVESALKGLPKHLVQIFTGEGKSVTLAITATTLAILGAVVDCACYSEYLSKRDYEGFASLFTAFEVKKYIFYGTFHKLCENFINQDGDIRQYVESDISGRKRPDSVVSLFRKGRPKILLIDEVDVFFSKDFYGNLYKPLSQIRDTTIDELLKYVWANRNIKNNIQFNTLKTTKQFLNCLKRFTNCSALIEECVKTMLSDLKDFESQDYVVDNDRIGYKDQDSVSYDIYYGYKTIFAYFKESEANPPRITKPTLDSKLVLTVDCGSYSYAEIPKQYDSVMGVTGTLKTLSNPEKKLLTDVYKIQIFSYIPSVYGKTKLNFGGDSIEDCKIESQNGIHTVIRNEINKRIQPAGTNIGNSKATKRSVLVFFESVPKLIAFYNSSALADIKSNVTLLIETTPTAQKEGIIRKAVMPNSITLLTRVFGRGTDFICYDENLLVSGGIHVIQTFISDELSEETQIQGRTARQGNTGSYSMVIVDKDLEKYGINDSVLESMRNKKELYSVINKKRCAFFEGKYPDNMKYVDEIKRDHVKSMAFVASLLKNDQKSAMDYLFSQNKGPVVQAGTNRTICLMDATGSMSNLLSRAKNSVKDMFERIQFVFQEKNITTVFFLQFVVYRNYSSTPEFLLQFSSWESQANALRVYMDNINVDGGLGNEAVEVGLAHVLAEHAREKVDQVLLIGDMPPNTRAEVTSKRASYHSGEATWKQYPRFKDPVFTDDLVPQLKAADIPVQGFYVGTAARAAFEDISSKTGGKAMWLDINSSAGADSLIHCVCESVLLKAGGDNGKELVDAYRAQFRRGFVSS
jgi:hypothetical protein